MALDQQQRHGVGELRQGLVSCGLVAETASRCCFHNSSGSVGDDIFVTGAPHKKRQETRDQLIGPGLVTRKSFTLSIEHCAGGVKGRAELLSE